MPVIDEHVPAERMPHSPAGISSGATPAARHRLAALASTLADTLKSIPVAIAFTVLSVVVFVAIFAPWLGTTDPVAIEPAERLRSMSAEHWLGTDAFGRDTWSRVVYGARVSLAVGIGASLASIVLGLAIGVVAGYFRMADAIIMRVMDGIMSIPSVLLAIALVALTGGTLVTVLVAITVPEVPRVVRLVRGVILSVCTESYVEAAISLGTRTPRLLMRHLVPSTVAPLIVQGTHIFAAAILIESTLSFLGAGLPPAIPSWGNMMAEGRMYFQLKPGLIAWPGIVLALTLLSVNVLGDVLRDVLDPRMAQRS